MNPEFKTFLAKVTALLIVLIAVGFVAFYWFIPRYFNPVYLVAALFFYAFTLIVHAWQIKSAQKSLSEFTRSNMVAMFVKLLVYLAFAITFLAINKKNAIAFAAVVMVLYVSFNIVEVTSLAKFSRSLGKKKQQPDPPDK
jgi:hypothetical protein